MRKNQELRDAANRIDELETQVATLEHLVQTRTRRSDLLEKQLAVLAHPPLTAMRTIVRRTLLCHAVEMGIDKAVLELDTWLDERDEAFASGKSTAAAVADLVRGDHASAA